MKIYMIRMMKKCLGLIILLSLCGPVWAQTEDVVVPPTKSDDATYRVDTAVVVYKDTIVDVAVITNSWKHNWFVSANVGYHKFWGDYNSYGKLKDTFAPSAFANIGRWVTPTFGFSAEAGLGMSKGFTTPDHLTPYSVREDLLLSDNGKEYYRQKIKWWDAGMNLHLNLSRLALGYEGAKSKSLMGQFVFGAGIGWVHHFGYEKGNPKLNEISGKLELQYSQFLSRAKRVSLDLKLRYTAYQTNFDGNYDYEGCQHWDRQLGLAIGLTFHSKHNTWTKPLPIAYQTVYKTREDYNTVEMAPIESLAKLRNLTFYVLYPDGNKVDIAAMAKSSFDNNHASLQYIVDAGYKTAEDEKLYSYADVYAAIMKLKGENVSVPGADNTTVNELMNMFMTCAMTKMTVMSITADMDYYANSVSQQKQNIENVRLANERAHDIVNLLRLAPRMESATPQILLVDNMDINREQCVKVTLQYLSE